MTVLSPLHSSRHRGPAPALIRCAASVLLVAVLGAVQAHGSLVLGAVSLSPDPPLPGQPLVISVVLATSGNAPVEGARLAGGLAPAPPAAAGAPGGGQAGVAQLAGAPLTFTEYPEPYGTYRARLTAPSAGDYRLTVRDHTYAKENVTASVTLRVGGEAANGALDFAFPPSSPPRSIVSWLLWLVGLPLAAGVVVTVLVLRSKRAERDGHA